MRRGGEGKSRTESSHSTANENAPLPVLPPPLIPRLPTQVMAELAHQPAPGQCCHSEAAVPVATAEQQLPVGGYCQGMPIHATARRPGATQEPQHPDPNRRLAGEPGTQEVPWPSCIWPRFRLVQERIQGEGKGERGSRCLEAPHLPALRPTWGCSCEGLC